MSNEAKQFIDGILKENPMMNSGNEDAAALKYNPKDMIDDIGTFWVVTKATPESEIEDILFKSSVLSMVVQFRGGLKPEEIIIITPDEDKALDIAHDQIVAPE